MIVVADTGPLHYLALIGCLDILPALFGTVLVPRLIISQELNDPSTPQPLRILFGAAPPWLIVHDGPALTHPAFSGLGAGERQAISLLLELNGDLLLCDDAAARKRAAQSRVPFVGMLGLVDEAAIGRLQTTNFHHTPPLIDQIRQQHRVRMANPPDSPTPEE